MTKVKKTKKLKAKKSGKKPVTKTVFSGTKGSASVEKIDRRLRPTPESKLIKIDPMLKNPLKIVDVPRSQIYPYQQIPTYMFSGQDTGNLNRQFDILKSKEQQLESKFLDLKKELDKEKQEKKDLEQFSEIQGLSQRVENYKNNVGGEDIVELNNEIKQLLKDKTLDSTNRDLLLDLRIYAKESIKQDVETIFKEVKSTNTLLDDKIHNNNLVDEAEILMEEIKGTNIKGSINLPSFEAVELLGEMQSSKIKGPIILPTFEEAVQVIKKPRGRPKKEKVNELVEVKQTNTLLDDVIIDNILDDVSASVGEEYDPQASTRRRQQFVNQARLELEQSERAFDEKMRLNSIRLGERVEQAKERRGMMEEDEPYQTAMWRIVGTTKKRSDLLS